MMVETQAAAPSEAAPSVEPSEAAATAHLASGLVLSSPSQTTYVDSAGQVIPLVDQPHAELNADLNRLLFSRPDPQTGMGDIWLQDRSSGEERNLTQTPDRDEVSPRWWPAHPEIAFFLSGTGMGMENSENPTIVGLDGTGYQILDETRGGPFSLSPDGEAIAYGGFDQTGMIYHWDGTVEQFVPADYGLSVEKILQPAYSPDGRYLAWQASGDLKGDGIPAIGLAVFDLQTKTAQLLHVYQPQGGGMVPHYIAWSPDGSEIAFVTFGEPPASGRVPNLWVLKADGSGETYVDAGVEPAWSPDGRSLAYILPTLEGGLELRIADAESWTSTPVDDLAFPEPPQFIMDWLAPGAP
jgi:hypothetical protein